MDRSQVITLSDNKQLEIRKLPLRKYGELMLALQGVFKELMNEFDGVDTDQIVERLPMLISNHLPEAAGLVEVGTFGQVSANELLDERGLDDAILIVTTIVMVNDVANIAAQIKKAMAAFKKPATAAAQQAVPAMQAQAPQMPSSPENR